MQLVLIRAANKFNPPIYSYEELAKKVLGWPGQFMLAFFTVSLPCLGACDLSCAPLQYGKA